MSTLSQLHYTISVLLKREERLRNFLRLLKNGKIIQVSKDNYTWEDLLSEEELDSSFSNIHNMYRVKPKTYEAKTYEANALQDKLFKLLGL